MKRSYILFLCLYFILISCAKEPPLPTTEEVKGIVLKQLKENIQKSLRAKDYDNIEIEVSNIEKSGDYDPKTRRVS